MSTNNIKILTDVELSGAMAFSKNYADFPSNPQPRSLIVKDGVPYIYTELLNGSGFYSWQPLGIKQSSFIHTQGVASTRWVVTHNFNTEDFAYFVYDSNHRLIIANIEIVDLDTIHVQLSEAITGTVVLFSLQFLNSTTLSATQQLNLGSAVLTATAGVLEVSGNPVAFKGYVDAQDAVLSSRIDNIATSNIDSAALSSLSATVSTVQAAVAALGSPAGSLTQNFSVKDLSVAGNILPAISGVSTIGTPTDKFSAIYTKELHIDANTLYVDGVPVIGSSANTIQIGADVNQGIRIATTGTGQMLLDSQTATTIQTSGLNADVLIQSSGTGSMSRVTSSTQVILTAPIINIQGTGSISGDLTVVGNMTVNGTTTSVNTANMSVKDNIVTVNKGEAGSGISLRYAGFEIDRGDLSRERLVFDETLSKWVAGQTLQEVALATEPFVTSAIANIGSTISKSNLGLNNVDNTSDLLKPISTATQTALNLKANISTTYSKSEVDTAIASATPTISFTALVNKPNTISGYGIIDAMSKVAPGISGNTLVSNGTAWISQASSLLYTAADVGLSNVDNTADMSKPISAATATALNLKAPIASPTFSGTVYGITKAMVGLGNVDNTTDLLKPISTATLTALNLKANISTTYTKIEVDVAISNATTTPSFATLTGKPTTISGYGITDAMAIVAPSTSGNLLVSNGTAWISQAATVTYAADLGLGNVNNTSDLLKPISTAAQSVLNLKANISTTYTKTEVDAAITAATPVMSFASLTSKPTTIAGYGIIDAMSKVVPGTSGNTLVSNGTAWVSQASNAMYTAADVGLGNVNNTSDMAKPVSTSTASALNLKAPIASPTFTGTVYGITKAMVGLGNIDNTTDLLKPISTATQDALDLKADKSYVDTLVATKANTSDVTTSLAIKADKSYVDTELASMSSATGSLTQDFSIQNLSVSGDILPAIPGVSSIGSTTDKFLAIYTKELHLDASMLFFDGVPVIGATSDTIQITANVNQGIRIATTGTGSLLLYSQDAVTVQTSGSHADVLIQSSGTGALTRVTSATEVVLSAPLISVQGNEDISGDLTVNGNLTVNGTTIAVDTTNMTVKDNIITVNNGETGSGISLRYAGFEVDRGDLARERLVFDETLGKWVAGPTLQEVALATEPFVTAAVANIGSTISKSNIGLDNVDNTSDLLKPVSTATQAALDLKATVTALATETTARLAANLLLAPQLTTYTKTEVDTAISNATATPSFASLTGKPTTITGYGITDAMSKVVPSTTGNLLVSNGTAWVSQTVAKPTYTATEIGLSNVNNTSDLAKPISTATQNALDLTAAVLTTYTKTEVDTAISNATATPSFASLTGKPTTISGYGITDAMSKVAPSTAGNVLLSNGTAWLSQAIPASTFASLTGKPTTLFGYGITDAMAIVAPGALGNSLVSNGSVWVSQAGASGASITDDNSTSTTQYIGMTRSTSGILSTAYTASSKLYFNPGSGVLNATIFNSLSDASKKTNVVIIENAVATVSKIEGVEFDWIDNGDKSAGVIAQQLETVIPHLINTNEDGLKSVNYSGLIGYLIEAIKELSDKVEKLENK